MSPNVEGKDLTPLFEQILEHIPAPHVDTEGPTRCSFLLLTTTSTSVVSASAVSSAAR